MGFTLEAILLDPSAAQYVHGLPTVVLSQGITLLPITDEVFDDLVAKRPGGERRHPFWKFSGALEYLIVDASRHGHVAYIEADYFGGSGTQTAAVWRDGTLILEPEHAQGVGPINHALRLLGVVAEPPQDEFSAVNLGHRRRTSDWMDEAMQP